MARAIGIFSAVAVFSRIVVATFCVAALARAAEPLLCFDQLPVEALFLGSKGFPESKDAASLEFQIAHETRLVRPQDLIRWSNPQSNTDRPEAILADGSRLVLAESWAGKKSLQISEKTATLLTETFGKVLIARNKLRAVLLAAPKNRLRRSRLRDQLLAWQGKTDRLWLDNGDTLVGKLLEIGPSRSSVKFLLDGASEQVSFPIRRLTGLSLGSSSKTSAKGLLAIGWRDGSVLLASRLFAEENSLQIELACGLQLAGTDLREIVHLRSLASRAVFLSDLEVANYFHEPFLTIPWKYRRDRNLQGGPLAVRRLIYPKGLAVHSASRLTYDLLGLATRGEKKRFHRFAAQVALDDSAGGQGSVVFQVFLRKSGELQLALATPIVRGTDAPRPISVELGSADQIVLAVEYADHAEQHDHANWLDARLE